MNRPRARSALRRLSLAHGLTFLIVAGLFFAGALAITARKNQEKAEALLTADIADLRDKLMELPAEVRIEAARAIVGARANRSKGLVRYAVVQGDALQGDPTLLQASRPDRPRLDGKGLVARRLDIAPDAAVLVGRTVGQTSAERDVALAGLLGIVLAALGTLVVGPWVSARLVRRVRAVNAACEAFGAGDLGVRAPGSQTDDEFGELSRSVNAMFARIETLVAGVRGVSDRVAHDLRTPLARIKDRLSDIQDQSSLTEARQTAAQAARDIDHLLDAFNALLDLSELQAGVAPATAAVRLDQIVADVAALYEPVARDCNVVLVLKTTPLTIQGNTPLLTRALANLIDNALKHAPPGTDVIIEADVRDEQTIVSVKDHGPGVDEAQLDRLFDRFRRAPGSHGPGHGLGLALVQAVARLHGGDATLESPPGGGFTAKIHLR